MSEQEEIPTLDDAMKVSVCTLCQTKNSLKVTEYKTILKVTYTHFCKAVKGHSKITVKYLKGKE